MKTKTSKSPSYLVRNSYTYCFRIKVPNDLQIAVGKKELRYSLKAGYLGLAKQKAQLLAGQVHLIFSLIRRGDPVMRKFSDDQIQTYVDNSITLPMQFLNVVLHSETVEKPDLRFFF